MAILTLLDIPSLGTTTPFLALYSFASVAMVPAFACLAYNAVTIDLTTAPPRRPGRSPASTPNMDAVSLPVDPNLADQEITTRPMSTAR